MHYPKVLEGVDSPSRTDMSPKFLVDCPCFTDDLLKPLGKSEREIDYSCVNSSTT